MKAATFLRQKRRINEYFDGFTRVLKRGWEVVVSKGGEGGGSAKIAKSE